MEEENLFPKVGDTINGLTIFAIKGKNPAVYLLKKDKNQKNFDTLVGPLKKKKSDAEGHRKWKIDNGYIQYTWSDGARYEGNWKDGQFDGEGILFYPNGKIKYKGNWKDGERDGEGIYIWSNGASYVGNWKDGERHGKGKYIYPDGASYEGNWVNGCKKGKGTYIKKTMSFEGKYIDDVPVYFTKITIKDENKKLHIITKDNDDKYYYQTGEEGEKTEIDMKNQKRLKEALLQLGTGRLIFENEQEKYEDCNTPKEFETFIKNQIELSKDKEPIIKIIGIPGHAFTMLFENGKAYVYDIGGLRNTDSKEYSNVVKGNENIEYCKIESDLNLEFSLTNDKEISFKIDEDDHMCRHQALLIFQKLTELKTKPLGKEEGTLHDELMEYIESEGADNAKGPKLVRINSLDMKKSKKIINFKVGKKRGKEQKNFLILSLTKTEDYNVKNYIEN